MTKENEVSNEELTDEVKEEIKETPVATDIEKITQKRDEQGAALTSEEAKGIYNGLELSLSILEGREPVYKTNLMP